MVSREINHQFTMMGCRFEPHRAGNRRSDHAPFDLQPEDRAGGGSHAKRASSRVHGFLLIVSRDRLLNGFRKAVHAGGILESEDGIIVRTAEDHVCSYEADLFEAPV